MKPISVVVLFLLAIPSAHALDESAPWDAQDQEWETVFDQSSAMHRYERHEAAAETAEKAVQLAEKKWGPSHFHVAQSLLLLGCCLEDQGQFAKAEAAYKRALDIAEKVEGPGAPTVAGYAFCLAEVYRRTGRAKEADALETRSRMMLQARLAEQKNPYVPTSELPNGGKGTR